MKDQIPFQHLQWLMQFRASQEGEKYASSVLIEVIYTLNYIGILLTTMG